MVQPIVSGPGYELFPLEQATEGHIQVGILLEHEAPTGPDSCDPRQVLRDFFGQDLLYNRSGHLEVGSKADLLLCSGAECVKANIARALVTVPGDLVHRPDYGVGIQDFVNLPATPANFEELKARIRASLESNQDVETIEKLEVKRGVDVSVIEIELVVRVSGQPVQLAVGVRRA